MRFESTVLNGTITAYFAESTWRRKAAKSPWLVVVSGLDKPFRTELSSADYASIRELGDEYFARNPRPIDLDD